MAAAAPVLDDALVASARNGEFDRYVAGLLAPPAAREGLVALAAFSAELARIAPATQREPAMGEIRLQWWRDALEIESAGATGHPLADRLHRLATARAWPVHRLHDIIDAHAHDHLADPFADDQELTTTLELGEGTLFELAAVTLGAPAATVSPIARHAGLAYGLARRLAALRHDLARRHLPIPTSRLTAQDLRAEAFFVPRPDLRPLTGIVGDLVDLARDRQAQAARAATALPRRFRIAFLPLAMVEPYLRRALAGVGSDKDEMPSDFQRMLRLTRARLTGRL